MSTTTSVITNTSVEAYEMVKPYRAPSLRNRVHGALNDAGINGMIVEELESKLGERENSLRPRLTELLREGKAQVTGVRRNSRGVKQKVWAIAHVAA